MDNNKSIHNLPDEVLSKILEYCPKTEHSVLLLENVCPKWNKIVNKHQGVFLISGNDGTIDVKEVMNNSRIRILLDHSFEAAASPIIPPIMISNDTAPSSSLNDHGDGNPHQSPAFSTIEETQSKLLSPPDYVKKLSFVGEIPIQVPGTFLNICKNLTGIHFHLSSLAGIPASAQLVMDIPTLQTFVIDSIGLKRFWIRGVKQSMAKRIKMGQVFDVAIALLNQNNFPHLQSLIMDIPHCLEKEKAIVSATAAFLGRHHDSIQTFCYHQGFKVTVIATALTTTTSDSPEDTDSDLGEEDEDKEVSLAVLASNYTDLEHVSSLKQLHIGLYEPQDSDPLWITLIIQQTQLMKLIFTGDRIPFPGTTIFTSQSTITTLIFEMRDNMDCILLKNCSNLKKLSLLGHSVETAFPDDDDDLEDDDLDEMDVNLNIFNLHFLPKSVVNLRINRLKIDRKQISEVIFSERYNKLKELEIIDCGIERTLGVSLEAIAHIFMQKTLSRFQIDYSLNRNSVYEIVRHPSRYPPYLKLLAYSIQCNSVSNFTVQGQLNAMGWYDPAESTTLPKGFRHFEPDMYEFPEEIYPTGIHRDEIGTADEEETDGPIEEVAKEENDDTEEKGSDNGGESSSYEDMDTADEEA